MNCSNCDKICKEYRIDNLLIYYCTDCWDFIKQDFIPCENHKPDFVKFTNNGGSIHLKKQCSNCGRLDSRYYKKDNSISYDTIPFADIDRAKAFENIDYEKLSDIYKRYDKKRKQFQKEKSFEKFIEEHNAYLKTADWRKRRELVLKRDNFLCQSCLDNKATQVHHKSYRYWKNEPLFELVSVCDECHKIITEMNRDILNFKSILK